MMRMTLTHALLAAIFVVLVVLAMSPRLLPAANAANPANPGQPQILGCHVKYAGAGCTWIPIAVDSEGRLLVSMK